MTKKKHAKYSSSAAHRWMNCHGSIQLSEKAPPQSESKYAQAGTDAHTVLELILRKQKVPRIFTTEMHDYAVDAAVEILKRTPDGADLLIETKAPLHFLHPDAGGTLDVAVVEHFGTLEAIDYKFGMKVVEPKNNPQIISYALSIAHEFDYNFKDIKLTIMQPRAFHKDGPYRSATISIKELFEWRDKFKRAIDACEKPNPTLTPGEWCYFCPAKIICPEQTTKALAQAQADFEPATNALTLPDPTKINLATLGETVQALERLEFWIAEIRAYAFQTLERGGKVKGYKLVPKRGTRKWVDVAKIAREAEKKFGRKAFSTDLLSPAQLEKLNPKWVAARCTNVSSGMTMVSDTDERDSVNQIDIDFNDDLNDKKKISKPKKQ